MRTPGLIAAAQAGRTTRYIDIYCAMTSAAWHAYEVRQSHGRGSPEYLRARACVHVMRGAMRSEVRRQRDVSGAGR